MQQADPFASHAGSILPSRFHSSLLVSGLSLSIISWSETRAPPPNTAKQIPTVKAETISGKPHQFLHLEPLIPGQTTSLWTLARYRVSRSWTLTQRSREMCLAARQRRMPGRRLPISSLLRTIPIYPRKSTSKLVGTVTWSVRPPARPPCSWLCICHATLSGRRRRHFPQPNHPTLAPNSAPFSSSSLIAPKSCCLLASLVIFFLPRDA